MILNSESLGPKSAQEAHYCITKAKILRGERKVKTFNETF